MPNYCENTLYITGRKTSEVLKAISAANGTPIDFEAIIPIPDGLVMKFGGINDLAILCATKPDDDLGRYATYPWVIQTGVTSQTDLCRWHGTTRQEMVERGQQVLDIFKTYFGIRDVDVYTVIWGTKWNAIDPVLLSSDTSKAKIAFFTAWGPPLPVIEVLAQRFPDHNFKLRYVGECNEFRGVLEIKRGVITADKCWHRMWQPNPTPPLGQECSHQDNRSAPNIARDNPPQLSLSLE
jgi:hypothetical protein